MPIDTGVTKKEQISNRNHSIYTVPLIEEILKDNKITTKELNEIIDNYFKSKHLDNFAIEDIKLQIVGRYI